MPTGWSPGIRNPDSSDSFLPEPVRGEVWLADLNPTRGREQAGQRPVRIVSVDEFNRGPAELVVVLPITSTIRPIPLHMIIHPPEGGLKAVLIFALIVPTGRQDWSEFKPNLLAGFLALAAGVPVGLWLNRVAEHTRRTRERASN